MVVRLGGLDPNAISARLGIDDLDHVPVRRAPVWLMRVWGPRAVAMTVPWAIYVNPRLLSGDRKTLGVLLHHELVHVRQWGELGVARFLIRYLTDYWRGRRSGLTHHQAYLAISLEEEARRLSGH